MKNRGYTLVEILIATSIFVAVVGIAVATFNSASGFQSKTQAIQETNQAARFVIEKISRDIRSADGEQAIYSTGRTNSFKVFGFVLIDGQDELLANPSTSTIRLAVIKKGQGECSQYEPLPKVFKPLNQVILYYVTNDKKIAQEMRYVDSSITGLSQITNTTCTGSSSTNLLSNRVEYKDLKFSGLYPLQDPDPTKRLKQEPYLTIELKVRSLGYDPANSSESAEVDLKTSVVPRLDWFKY